MSLGFWAWDVGLSTLHFGFGILILDFGCLGFGFWSLDFRLWTVAFGFCTSGVGDWILDFVFWASSQGFCILCHSPKSEVLRLWTLGLGSWPLGYGLCVTPDFAFRMLNFRFSTLTFGL